MAVPYRIRDYCTMADAGSRHKTRANPLFLREEELRQAMELLFFAYRDFTSEADAVLVDYGFGHAHHRVIYFVGRNPGMSVTQLLGILKITFEGADETRVGATTVHLKEPKEENGKGS